MSPLRPRAAVPLLTALLLAWVSPAGADDPEELRRTFLELINVQREGLGLQPLVLEPALVRAAQAHADDMTARQYAGFSSPQGRQSEDWTREAGYAFQVFTAKLAFTAEPPQAIAREWKPESNRNSLFHPEVRDLGVGIGEVRGTPIYSFMLARSERSYLDRYIAELYDRQSLALENVETLREELLRRVNEARAGAKLHALTRHPALDRAAQKHAEAVLGTIRSGSPLITAGPLAAKVKLQKYRVAGVVGERVVMDALNPEQALAELLDESRGRKSVLFARGFTQMGTGLAFERIPEGFRIVWSSAWPAPLPCRPRQMPGRSPRSPDGQRDGTSLAKSVARR